jgi:signal transduction histidine kinase/ligand-binding sensor domain-containing protein
MRCWRHSGAFVLAAVLVCARGGMALDPHKSLTQYSRTIWTQEQGLPQDTIRIITQTRDGYLWLGTDEGLARFDGYEFVIFNKANGDLPANSITALTAAPDGSLWIGTSNGLAQYRDGRFRSFTMRQGLPDNTITWLYADHAGTVWVVAGVNLSRFEAGRFANFAPGPALPVTSVRVVAEDRQKQLLVAGFSGVGRMSGGKYTPLLDNADLGGDIVTGLVVDRHDNLWIAGSLGMIVRTPSGRIRKYGPKEGLPDSFVRAMWEDRDGNIWAGTNGGLARLQGDRFVPWPGGGDLVRCLFEDSEGDIWVGANNGLSRLRDDIFRVYGTAEGLPSDEPNEVFQDHTGRIWVGFHDEALLQFSPGPFRKFTPREGMPDSEVFSIREDTRGDLMMGTRAGLVRTDGTHFRTYVAPDPYGRRIVFDSLEESADRLWLATPNGLGVLEEGRYRKIVGGSPLLIDSVVTLCRGQDGSLWAGSYGKGLWLIRDGAAARQYTVADGLSSDQIRALYQAADGTLWIGTFGGGLDSLRDGVFHRFTQKDGLLSDNIGSIVDDGSSLWLSTTRGICRVPKSQLREFADGARRTLDPMNYGPEDGLRSAQCAPAFPTAGGAKRTADGRLWFTTSRGLAVFDPHQPRHASPPPAVHFVEIKADGQRLDMTRPARLTPGEGRIQLRYTAIHLSAPERVRYSYRLDGLDSDWVTAGTRRVINYNSLRHGAYRFTVRAQVTGGSAAEESYQFELLPHYYETVWFRGLCVLALLAAAWGIYQARLRQIRWRFSVVLAERARLAREIHDTLAQGFVGISSQLDAVAMNMPDEPTPARTYLEMARHMARHSLTEARRSVMDLRASVLVGQDLAAALESGSRMWTAGSGIEVELDVNGAGRDLPQEMEQHLLRIAQEAVANAVKHAKAGKIRIKLHMEAGKLFLRIQDDGRGFEQKDAFSPLDGHFGLIGMRERAERLGGQLRLISHPGEGTEVAVTVPLP